MAFNRGVPLLAGPLKLNPHEDIDALFAMAAVDLKGAGNGKDGYLIVPPDVVLLREGFEASRNSRIFRVLELISTGGL